MNTSQHLDNVGAPKLAISRCSKKPSAKSLLTPQPQDRKKSAALGHNGSLGPAIGFQAFSDEIIAAPHGDLSSRPLDNAGSALYASDECIRTRTLMEALRTRAGWRPHQRGGVEAYPLESEAVEDIRQMTRLDPAGLEEHDPGKRRRRQMFGASIIYPGSSANMKAMKPDRSDPPAKPLDDGARLMAGSDAFEARLRHESARRPICSNNQRVWRVSLRNHATLIAFRRTLRGRFASPSPLAEFQEYDAKVRTLMETSIVGACIFELDGDLIDANETFLNILGYSRADLLADSLRWPDLSPPDQCKLNALRFEQLKGAGRLPPFETEYMRKDGSRVPVLVDVARFGECGERAVVYVVDLSDRKQAEKEASESQRRFKDIHQEMERANRLATLGQLSASIAHEVNQPIAAAVVNAQTALRWLEAETPDLDKARQAVARVVENGRRASDVITGIRSLARKEAPRQDRLVINDLIQEAVALTRGEALQNELTVRMQLQDDLPQVGGDRAQLQQVALNLIVNAAEAVATVEGTRELQITSRWLSSGAVRVAMADSGPGFTEAASERLFEAFYTTKPSGIGMGLPICRAIIEAHGGRLWATANAPRGAIFQFTLPPAFEAGRLAARKPHAGRDRENVAKNPPH